jgi:hypothetical protein
MPPSEITATPVGSPMGSPAPMAAAIGSSIRCTLRAPAARQASRTAFRSTSVMPDGAHMTTRGWAKRLVCTRRMK